MQQIFGTSNIIPISLGYNCHVKVFIDNLGEMDNRAYLQQPFDWFGSQMWGVYEAIENNFSGLTDSSLIHLRKRFSDKPTEYLTHDKYNFCYLHDYGKQVTNLSSISAEKWKEVSEKYERRIDRWNATLQKGVPLLFIRLEQDFANRIKYPEFDRNEDEMAYLRKFSELMKSKGVSFLILYLSTSFPKSYDKEHCICTVQFQKKRPADIIGAQQIQQIIQGNLLFIRSSLRDNFH